MLQNSFYVFSISMTARYQDIRIAHRVLARYLYGTEFPSEEALKEYLHEHPGADPKNHSVVKPSGKDNNKKLSLKERLHSLSGKAKTFFESAPKTVQSFVHDPEARKEVTAKAAKALKDASGKVVKGALHHIKHEAEEWKVASQGVHAVLTGKDLSKEQKHAMRNVAIEIALTVTVTALTGGVTAGATGMLKKTALSYVERLAKKIALNAVSDGLGNLATLQHLYHGAHGAAHLLSGLLTKLADEDKKPSEEEILGYWVAGLVAKQLEKGISDDDTLAALDEST